MEGQGMTDYTKLVKALRCCAGAHTKPTKCPDYDDSWCGGNCLDNHLIAAAAAIEELQTVLKEAEKKQAYQHDCICELTAENEELKDEVKQLEPKRGDLVEVVRCKDCRYFYFGFCHNRDGYVKFGAVRDRDWFCADAKKEVQDD